MTSVDRLGWQPTLFAPTLNRFELLKLKPDFPLRSYTLRVYRNHGVEQVLSALPPFLAFRGLEASINLSDYDDALTFGERTADVCLVWIDFDRYERLGDEELSDFVLERLDDLRASGDGLIVVANAPCDSARASALNPALQDWVDRMANVQILDLYSITTGLGESAFNIRRQHLTATRLSDASCLQAARQLGLCTALSRLDTPIKALAVDLDNTIYHGVLGEDGPINLTLTDDHRLLQEKLVELHLKGVFLVICSKNEAVDVKELFRVRTDFPLKPEHIQNWQVSWEGKANGIVEAAKVLQIGVDAFLLIDDNLGELTSVGMQLPNIRLAYAGTSPRHTLVALQTYPALRQRASSVTDALRSADVAANSERAALAAAASDPRAYLASLEVELTLVPNPLEDRARLAEMCVKTNQFNLAIARLSDIEVDRFLRDPQRRAVMVYMRDRLADSGSVAVIFMRREGDVLIVEELCVSCRAMGRHLEDVMISAAIQGTLSELPAQVVRFVHKVGPRNQPGRSWLARFAATDLGEADGSIDIEWDMGAIAALIESAPVTVQWSKT